MTILVNLRKMSDKPSGIGMYTYNFIKALIKESKDINILGVSDMLISDEIIDLKKYINIFVYGKKINKKYSVIKYFKYIQQIINEIKPDVFWETNNIIPILIKNPYGRIITTIHDIFPITSAQNYNILYKVYFKFCIKRTIKMSDELIYVSEFTKTEVENRFREANRRKSFISYNIVELKNYSVSNKNIDKNYFLFVGNIESRKGVDILIKAFDEYKKMGGKNKLYLCGSMRDYSIKELIQKVSSKNSDLKYLGYVNEIQKIKLLEECSAFVFPSRAEGFGIPIIEAMSFNKPCIISDLDIFKEIVGESAIYFEISKEDKISINNLKEALFNFENTVSNDLFPILNRYTQANLGAKLYDFIIN